MTEKKRKVVESAVAAFFEEVAKHYPEVVTGDFPPCSDLRFSSACEDAIQTWLEWNHPDLKEEL